MGVSTDFTKSKTICVQKISIYLTKQRYENKSFVNAFLVSKKLSKGIQNYETIFFHPVCFCVSVVCFKY